MITVTKGQWFPLTIGNISYAGAAFDLQGATEVSASLVSTLGVKSPMSFEITAFNEISAVCDGSLSAGKYGIEVSCKGADGKAYRMKSPGAIIEVSASTRAVSAAVMSLFVFSAFVVCSSHAALAALTALAASVASSVAFTAPCRTSSKRLM